MVEALNTLTNKYKEGGLEMDGEIVALVNNARMKIEKYKGEKEVKI